MSDIAAELQESRRSGQTALAEPAAKGILSAYGIAVPRSVTMERPEDAESALAGLRPPLAAKLISLQAIHKSDLGGVKLGLETAQAVMAACREIGQAATEHGAAAEGFLVEEMAPAGTEVVIGGMIDPTFGPTVMFGLGGIFVELLADVSFRICPIEPIDAREMIGDIRAAAVLRGARGRPPVSEEAIVQALLGLGGADGLLMAQEGLIGEVDINPLIVSENGAVAADARIILAEKEPAIV